MISYTLAHLLAPIDPLRALDGVTDIMVNQPGRIVIERHGERIWYDAPTLTFDALLLIATGCAFHTGQNISFDHPLCDATLPTGERVKLCIPPSVDEGTVKLSIRVPALTSPTLADLEERGMFEHYPDLPNTLRAAVHGRKNIMVAGAQGAGKTTLSSALIAEIPLDERLVTIEDTAEWKLPHENWVAHFYSQSGQSSASLTCEALVTTALRHAPDRVLMQELRDGAAFIYLLNALSGLPGGITTIHAGSAKGVFTRLLYLIALNPVSTSIPTETLLTELHDKIDLIVHCSKVGKTRRVTDVHTKGDA